jgi:tetratricopeptide (TPR) repeat protein
MVLGPWKYKLSISIGLGLLTLFVPFARAGQEAPAPASPSALDQTEAKREISLEERGDILMARKSYADAIDCYQRAVGQKTNREAILWNKAGIAYQQLDNMHQAQKAYERAFRLDKNFAEPYNNLGTTYFLRGNVKRSVKYYRKALQLNPNSAAFHINLGTSYFKLKKFAQAVDQYTAALVIDPHVLTEQSPVGTVVQARTANASFFYYLAKAFARQNNVEESVRYLRRSMEDGFNDMKKLNEDPDFQKISKTEAFMQLMDNPPMPIKE